MQRKVRIWWDKPVAAYRLSGDYDQSLIQFLKKNIPVDQRNYEEKVNQQTGKLDRIWTFTEPYFDDVSKLCNVVFGPSNVTILTKAQVEQVYQAPPSGVVKQLDGLDSLLAEFMHLLPFEAAQSAYRKAAFSLHPDKGGSMEKMSRLNAIWTRIEKEIYKQ